MTLHEGAGFDFPETFRYTDPQLMISPPIAPARIPQPLPGWFWLPVVAYLAGIVLFAGQPFALTDFPLDDAWIHQVYAKSFAGGTGFQYNPGTPATGATSPLWVMLSAPVHWLGGDSSAAALGTKILAITLGMAFLLVATGTLLKAGWPAGATVFGASLLALDPRFLFSSLSGMETNLLLCLWMSGIWLLVAGREGAALVLFGLAPVTRPEALVLLPLLPVYFLLRPTPDAPPPSAFRLIPAALLPTAVWAAFCWHTTGHPLPATFYVKAASFQPTLKNLSHVFFGIPQGGLLPLPVLFLLLAAVSVRLLRERTQPTVVLLLFGVVGPMLYLLGIALTRPVQLYGYYWTRWLDPPTLMLAGLALPFPWVWLAETWSASPDGHARRRRQWATAAGLLVLIVCTPFALHSWQDRLFHLRRDARAIRLLNVQAGLWIRENTPAGAGIGVGDAGAVKFFGGRRTIDLIGLNEPDIAFKRVSLAEIISRADWLVVFPHYVTGTIYGALYEPVHELAIPPEEYTISPSTRQNTLLFLRRREAWRDILEQYSQRSSPPPAREPNQPVSTH